MPAPGPNLKRATIRDVAALAGVSIGTASKALNGQGKLRAETRDRVAAAARELGFAPNVLARGLLAGRTYTVGVITTDSFGRFSIPVMLGAEDALGAGQISVFMCDTRDDPERERQYLDMLLSRRVDGLIVAGRRIEPRPSIGLNLGAPVVYAMTQSMDSDEPGDPARRRRWRPAGRRAPARPGAPPVRPHHRAGAVPGRPEARPGLLRRDGRGGRCRSPPTTCCTGSGARRWGREAARLVMRTTPGVDAIFCGSDQIARGVSDTLRLIGCRVPDDIALVGFDNWSPMVLGADPPLTSVDMCLEEVGRVAAEHLLLAINGAAHARRAHRALPPGRARLDQPGSAVSAPAGRGPRPPAGAPAARPRPASLTWDVVSGHNPPGLRNGTRILVSSKWVHKVLSVATGSGHGRIR